MTWGNYPFSMFSSDLKKVLVFTIFFFLPFVFCSCAQRELEPLRASRVAEAPRHKDPRCTKVAADSTCENYAVSIYELITTPEKYHNKHVALVGYVRFEFEGNAIYATKAHFTNRLTRDAIWIDVTGLKAGSFREGYAYIGGKFDRYDGGHFRVFPGALYEIDFFQPLKPREKNN